MGKILVAYFSAQEHTKRISERLAERLGADLFEIQPKQAYTEEDLDWTNSESRVSLEHEGEAFESGVELVSDKPENWDEYDTVLIGAPVWWGVAAWPVYNFVRENDFTGKTIYPFVVSHSSPLGGADKALQALSNSGDWKEGIRFSQSASTEELDGWAESLK